MTQPQQPNERAAAPMLAPAVEMVNITKRFPGVVANDQVHFELRSGEIHALLGENGAGKTTLMQMLGGLYAPDIGEVRIHGQSVRFHSPGDAIAAGVGMVYQHFMLIDRFTVADNIVLGQEPGVRRENRHQLQSRLRDLSQRYGLQVDPAAEVRQLSVGEQQRVEILKALYRGAQILILDEPTAVLTPPEVDELLAVLRTLAAQGTSIVLITHKLQEVMAVCDRVTVLRDGRTVGTRTVAACTEPQLAQLMVGRELTFERRPSTRAVGQPQLILEQVWAKCDRGLPALRGIDLTVRAGEIVGIAGVDGNGQRELEEVIAGLRPITQGYRLVAAPLAHIPSDRYRMGLISEFSVAENAVLRDIDHAPFSWHGLLHLPSIRQFAQQLINIFGIRVPSVNTFAGTLSGGNAQRLVLARELTRNHAQNSKLQSVEDSQATHRHLLILAAQPTRGLDINAADGVHQQLIAQRNAGAAILLISTELEEILRLCDRILVLHAGSIIGNLQADLIDLHQLGLLMAGQVVDG